MYYTAILSLGLFSGIISCISVILGGLWAAQFVPGFVFGLFMWLHYISVSQKQTASAFKLLGSIIFSGLAYFIAFWTFFLTNDPYVMAFEKLGFVNPKNSIFASSLLTAGLIGSIILLMSIHFFITKLSLKMFSLCILVGSILSLSWFLFPFEGKDSLYDKKLVHDFWFPLFSVFIFWQTGMALAIGWATKK